LGAVLIHLASTRQLKQTAKDISSSIQRYSYLKLNLCFAVGLQPTGMERTWNYLICADACQQKLAAQDIRISIQRCYYSKLSLCFAVGL
jgi:hypothetical protein